MGTNSRSIAQRQQKAQKGVFFISLALSATGVVLLMLLSLMGYMLWRGSARLFFSPTYVLHFTDGSTEATEINQNLEFDVIDEDGNVAARGATQAGKYYLNILAESFRYAKAPVPAGIAVEVWQDQEVEVPGWGEDEVVKQMKPTRIESIPDAAEFRYDLDAKRYMVVTHDGRERQFESDATLQFREGQNLLNSRTIVTRYLQNNPEEKKRREAEVEKKIQEVSRNGYPVDPRWKPFLVAHKEYTSEKGTKYQREERVKAYPAMNSFEIRDRWNWFQFFWDWPRSGNTEGGVWPCIFGTVFMTLIMTLVVAPFGVAAAVYLMEYARDNWMTRAIRLAVANLAGVPSIVFGLFGLGFFVLTIGGGMDRMFNGGVTKWGTPCVLWASLTMALLTLPVMIVASEEALRTVPRELREGALALGATKFSTILTVVIPTALPGILTGVILAVARAAGEVAPLLLTGVVPQKDQLPLSASFDDMFGSLQSFMNLAYHIYDLSVKSQPNKIEEAQALAFSSALVLVMVVLAMNVFAILLRARLSRVKLN